MTSTASDVFYRPHEEGLDWIRTYRPTTALVFGPTTDAIATTFSSMGIAEAKAFESPAYGRRLHDGTYVFQQFGEWHLLFVTTAQPGALPSDDRVVVCDSHLAESYYAREDHWKDAKPLQGESAVKVGALVRPHSQLGWVTVREIRRRVDGHDARVEINGRLETFDVADLELLEGDHRDPRFWLRLGPSDPEALLRTLTWLKLDEPLVDTLYSFAATKTTFKPYQFIPVLKMLSSSTGRILIADEVGLGKTIEAGLIWTELEQRQQIRRALVVVPAALRLKWRQEMSRRFMRELRELKIDDMRQFVHDVRSDRDPELIGVISLESLRGASDVLADLADLNPRFDLAIVDEAHALRNRSTRSNEVGLLLSSLADQLIFLSATPLNLRSSDLFNLIALLDEGGYPDESIFEDQLAPNVKLNAIARNVSSPGSRSRATALQLLEEIPDSQHGAALRGRPDFERLREILSATGPLGTDDVARIKRLTSELNTLGAVLTRTRKIDVPDKKAIREVEQVVVDWSPQERALYDAIYNDALGRALQTRMPLGFAMQMPLRQACSSLVVSQRKIASRERWLSDDDDSVYFGGDDEIEIVEEVQLDNLRIQLDHDTKLDRLKDRLRLARTNGMRQALIFSFFRGTVEYLAHELSDEARTAYLHGGVKVEDRAALIDRFRRGEIDVLVSNQVGSEGLDFEFCNVLVNYDLPWNPMQVEQRIGRLDRFGQKHDKIFIFNMMTPGTIESDIFGRLYDRIRVFEQSIGDLEPIMRETVDDLRAILDPHLSPQERSEQIDRYAVAMSRRADDIKKLEESSGMLTSMSLLEIEGLTADGPTSGRYIGAFELKKLLADVLARYEGSLEPTSNAYLFRMRGGDILARALRNLSDDSGTMHGLGRLSTLLRESGGLSVTFDPHYEGVANMELVTSRHPLIRLAVQDMRDRREELPRFGSLESPLLSRGSQYLVGLSLARTVGGLRPSTELWVTAVDLTTGQLEVNVADALLVGLAEGALHGARKSLSPGALSIALTVVESETATRRKSEQTLRTQENSALVQARIASERQSVQTRLTRAQERLAALTPESDIRLVRMREGDLRNRKVELDDVGHKYEKKLQLTLSVEDVALVVLSGPGDQDQS